MRKLLALALAFGVVGSSHPVWADDAAPSPSPSSQPIQDPWEHYNRWMYKVNSSVDQYTTRPIAQAYKAVVPKFMRQGLSNILNFTQEPWTLVNAMLQGHGDAFFQTLGRIMINGTVGLGGLLDTAKAMGVPRADEDFGQTLAVWGVPSGPYLVLPFFGPSNPRDAFGLVAAYFGEPASVTFGRVWGIQASIPYTGTQVTDIRAKLLDTADPLLAKSDDPYITVRSAYIQRRAYQISDGKGGKGPSVDDPFEQPEEPSPAPASTTPPSPQ